MSCRGACTKFCGNNDNCHASCSGSYGYLDMEVTLEMQSAQYPQLVTELGRVSGQEIAFTPANPNAAFNVGFRRASLWDALKVLADEGSVKVAGQDFEKLRRLRRSLLAGEKFSFCLKNTPVNTFVSDLRGITGLPLHVTAGRPSATANLELQNVGLNEIVMVTARAQTILMAARGFS